MAVNPVLRQLVADGKATKNAQSGTQTKMTAAKSAAQSTPMRRSLSNQQKTTSGTKKTDALTSAIISTNQKAAQKKTNTAERGSKHYTNRANQQVVCWLSTHQRAIYENESFHLNTSIEH